MSTDKKQQLIDAAQKARLGAYCPYSKYMVGAAVLGTDGKIYTGCNIENASFGATVCAERTALFGMVAAGCKKFTAIAVATGDDFDCAPCCICRQVMTEFCDSLDLPLYMVGPAGNIFEHTLREIAPLPFMAFDTNEDYNAEK